jgi:hypothetical protein
MASGCFNIHYWANALSPLAGRTKELALIKYDPRNLSRLFWEDKQGHYWPVPYRDLRLPPISLWDHRQAVRELRAQGRRSWTKQQFLQPFSDNAKSSTPFANPPPANVKSRHVEAGFEMLGRLNSMPERKPRTRAGD